MPAPEEVSFAQLLFAGIGVMLLAAAGLVWFLVTYQQRLFLQQQRLHAVETAHQRELLAAVIAAQERERERIGQDLHDGIGSTIATAKMLVSRLNTRLAAPNSTELFGLLEQLMGAAVHDVRSLSHSLYPAVLARFGLADALQNLADVGNETGTLALHLDLRYAHPLPLAQELAFYRICQELVHNAQKHAQGATRLCIALHQQGPRLTLVVEDDGCGFPAPAPGQPVPDGAGLRNIAVRVQMLGAQLQQQSAPGQGCRTTITFSILPL